MKANEAPEKLYLNWTEYPLNKLQVEYTRTDAFIEKACKWLRDYVNPAAGTYLFDEDIERFRKAMKGELRYEKELSTERGILYVSSIR